MRRKRRGIHSDRSVRAGRVLGSAASFTPSPLGPLLDSGRMASPREAPFGPLRFGAPSDGETPAGPRGATRLVPPDDPSRDPRRPVRIARGVSAVVAVIALVGLLQAGVMISIEARRLWTAEREIARLEREVADLRRETEDLIQIGARGDDERFREHLARRQGYVYPDEFRYVIVPPPASTLDDRPAAGP